MSRQEKRIARIKARIAEIDRRIADYPKYTRCRYRYPVALERLYERRDNWEARLGDAELGGLGIYSRGPAKGEGR